MSKQFEVKSIGGKVQDVDTTGRRVVLYAAAFGSVDSHKDIIHPGSFTKTIAENKDAIVHLLHHDEKQPVGKPLEMVQDGRGLLVTSHISDTVAGRDYLTLVNDGVLTENSIGYWAMKKSPNQYGGRNLTELKLKEYSSVTWASNPNAKIMGVKAAVAELLEREAVLQKALRTGSLHDDTYLYLEEQQAELKSAILEMIVEQPLDAPTEPEATQPTTPPEAPEPESKAAAQTAPQWAARFYAAYHSK